jgi:hypothetical protein
MSPFNAGKTFNTRALLSGTIAGIRQNTTYRIIFNLHPEGTGAITISWTS